MTDESYIKLALEIAKRGAGYVSPNPLVGCVIVKDESIIGAGFHECYGENHAELNAIDSAHSKVEGSTLYVNLEPCAHHGKTPPCVDEIISQKIKRVVIGTLDPNPMVSGKGIRKLKRSGIEVKVGILEKECEELNRFFFKAITKQLPYVTLKAAQTIDGYIADKNNRSSWISSVQSRRKVHKLRSIYDAVLIGTKTAQQDNPKLNVRLVEGRNPFRIIFDPNLKLSSELNVFKKNKDSKTIIITSKISLKKKRKVSKLEKHGVKIITVKSRGNEKLDLKDALKKLLKQNINSVLVEGGSRIYSSFIKENLFDDILVFLSPKYLGEGLPVVSKIGVKHLKDAKKLKIQSSEQVGEDLMIKLSR